MTLETVTTMQLQDVIAVEFECRGCGTKIVLRLSENVVVPLACNQCPSSRWFLQDGRDKQDLENFLRELRSYSGNAHYNLRFHVEGLDDED
jgi:hypothetical protein